MMILSMMGYPVAALPILTMVATIIDAPATVLNSVGDSVASMMVARVVDGKNWQEKNNSQNIDKEISDVYDKEELNSDATNKPARDRWDSCTKRCFAV